MTPPPYGRRGLGGWSIVTTRFTFSASGLGKIYFALPTPQKAEFYLNPALRNPDPFLRKEERGDDK